MSVFQVPCCDFVFISQPGALVPGRGFFYIIVIMLRRRGGCLAHNAATGVLFLLFHDVALLLCDEGHGSSFEAVTGDGCHSQGPGHGLMSAFYILCREPQAHSHVIFHELPLSHTNSLSQSHACRRTGDVVVNKKLCKQSLPVSNHPQVNTCHCDEKLSVFFQKNWYFALYGHFSHWNY